MQNGPMKSHTWSTTKSFDWLLGVALPKFLEAQQPAATAHCSTTIRCVGTGTMMNVRRMRGSPGTGVRKRGDTAPWEQEESPKRDAKMSFDDTYKRFDMDTTTLIGSSVNSKSAFGVESVADGDRARPTFAVRLWRQLPIVAMMLLIAFGYFVYVYKLCYRHLWRRKFYNVALGYGFVSHVLLLLLLWSYFHATYTHPGRVPVDVDPQSVLSWYEWTKCDKCKRHRPPRAHHCSTCGTCVLKMGSFLQQCSAASAFLLTVT